VVVAIRLSDSLTSVLVLLSGMAYKILTFITIINVHKF
jgi:hypothetical protein